MKIYYFNCLFYLIFISAVNGQNYNLNLEYQDFTTNTIHTFTYSNVNSDFGARKAAKGSRWHLGIDLNQYLETDYGDAVISPVNGIVKNIYQTSTGMWILVIDSDNDHRNFGYGHIFTAGSIPVECGNFVLKRMEYPNADKLCILDLQNNRAFGRYTGFVDYTNFSQPIEVNTHISEGWPVAPIGNSCAANGTHLHLYNLKDASLSHNAPNNALNPLQYLFTPQSTTTNFNVSIDDKRNITTYVPQGPNICYSGNSNSSIRVKVELADAIPGITYSNAVMDIEQVNLKIKNFDQPNTAYKIIQGNRFNNSIIYGGKLGNLRYPSENNPTGNGIDIDDVYGNWTTIGIDPFAYMEGSTSYKHDDFYFTDFYTRLSKRDNYNEQLYANINSDARYPDGIYQIKPEAIRVTGDQASNPSNSNNCSPITILIDNFCPYVSKVTVNEKYSIGPYKYSRGWKWSNNILKLEPGTSEMLISTSDVEIGIYTSEPMKEVYVTVNGYTSPIDISTTTLYNKDYWIYYIEKEYLNTGINQIIISGKDLNNNPIQSKPWIIPIRQSNTTWSPQQNPGQDRFHEFIYGYSPVDFRARQLGTDFNLMEFTDKSDVSGGYQWNFGDGTAPSNLEDVNHKYNSVGTYQVDHHAGGLNIVKNVVVLPLSQPSSNYIYSPDYFDLQKNTEIPVDFFSDCEGIIGEYNWDFGNGITSTEENPEDIMLPLYTHNTVSLVVTSGPYTDTFIKDIYLDPASEPYIIIVDFENTYFSHTLDILTSNFDDNYIKTFEIDFGDGTDITTAVGFETYHSFEHDYNKIGEYTVIATVSGIDLEGNDRTITYAKEISVQTDQLDITIIEQPTETPFPLRDITFTSSIFHEILEGSTYTGSWAIYKKGDPHYYFSENFAGSYDPSQPNFGLPSLVRSFEEAGLYTIIIDFILNGNLTGHAELDFEIVNAPDYLDVSLSGKTHIGINSSYTYEANIYPIGDPGVPEESWWATNVRWTLIPPAGQPQVIAPDPFPYINSQFLQYHTFTFNQVGTYTLRFEAWNNQHDYPETEINPAYINTISYYDACEKQIEVGNFPCLKLIKPEILEPFPLRADGTESIELQFTNPNSPGISWKIETLNGETWVMNLPEENSLHNLNNGEIITRFITPQPNLEANSRTCTIKISGFDFSGNQVQGSPSYFFLKQSGIDGPSSSLETGNLSDHLFGYSVSIDNHTSVIGSPSINENLTGVAYIYEKDNYGEWVRKAKLLPSENTTKFGESVSLHGDYVIIGGSGSGNVYIYKKPETGWAGNLYELRKIHLNGVSTDNSNNINVDIWGDYAVVGVPQYNKVYVLYRNSSGTDNWGYHKVLSSNYTGYDYFGFDVSIYNDKLAIGAPQEELHHGYIKVYNRNKVDANDWLLVDQIEPQYPHPNGCRFGQNVSLFENSIAASYKGRETTWPYRDVQYVTMFITNNLGEVVNDDIINFDIINYDINNISCIAAYKCLRHELYPRIYGLENPSDKDYWCQYGNPTFSPPNYPNSGILGEGFIYDEDFHVGYYYEDWHYFAFENYNWGQSNSISHTGNVTGVPGYYPDNSHGGALFINNYYMKSKYDAKISLELISFTKPAGNYSEIEAYDITLGGRSFPAVFESGSNTSYKGNSITLKPGFEVSRGAEWILQSIKPTTPLNNSIHREEINIESKKHSILYTIMKNHRDFPWYLYEPSELFNSIDLNSVRLDEGINILLPNHDRKLNTKLNLNQDEKHIY